MKKILLLAYFGCVCLLSSAQNTVRIIPEPDSIKMGSGKFIFFSNTALVFDSNDSPLQTAVSPLVEKLQLAAGLKLLQRKKNVGSVIEVKPDNDIPAEEGYRLDITTNKIQIRAKNAIGVFYAVQSLLQLLPDAIGQDKLQQNISWSVPCLSIIDAPRFAYRGVMLDVARNYMPIEFLKKLIDLLAMQKMNHLQLHLTDSQGWRFESKKYPKLTQIGAYRKGTALNTSYDYNARPNDSLYGGYYTQEQLRALVAYAAKRFVTIIPEIEMPAHSKSALASYPEFACLDSTGETFPYPQQIQDEYCTKDETFTFIDDILSEVMDIFPSKYIHIAGDEAGKENWKHCPICQKRMKEEGLKNVDELQSYFIQRVEKFVNSKGRSIIGWDEILQGGLAPNATVMSWTGIEGGIKAAQQHHNVIMTPGAYCYLDHFQSDAPGEPEAFGGLTTLAKAYSFDPVPAELSKEENKFVIGTQGNLWTEHIPTPASAEYMIFPRAIALAEVGWTDPSKKHYDDFILRLMPYLKRLDMYNVNYSRHLFEIKLNTALNNADETIASLSGVPKEYTIHYTTDGTMPTASSATYKTPFIINKSCTLKAAVLIDNSIVDQLKKNFILHEATAKQITLQTPPDKNYNKGGNAAWVNGSLGNDESFSDDDWLGWLGKDFNGTIDFKTATTVSSLHTRFFHRPLSWVWTAGKVTVQSSDDGINFKTIASKNITLPSKDGADAFELQWPTVTTKYLRIIVNPFGLIPPGNPGAGTAAWLFVDEMIVE